MTQSKPHRDDLAEMFREVVLVLGGVFAVRGTDDETICQVARGLERVYRRARQKGTSPGAPRTTATAPHPAIAGLLHLTDVEESR